MDDAQPPLFFKTWVKTAFLALLFLQNPALGQGPVTAVDAGGAMWLGRADGLFRLDSTGVSQRVMFDPSDSMRTEGPAVTALCAASDGRLWVGTMGSGLHLFDPRTGGGEHFRRQPGQLSGLPSDSIFAIFEGAKDLWVATPQGLSKWLPPLDLFRTFRPAAGEARRFFPKSIVSDEKDQRLLWLPTEGGAFLFDKKGESLSFHILPNAKPEGFTVPVTKMLHEVAVPPASGGADARRTVGLLLGAMAVFAVAVAWLFRWAVRRARREEQLKSSIRESENQLLRSQMNPQFIINTLTSIKNHILSNEKLLAADYLGGFALLLRNILDHSRSERIPLSDELDTLRLYVSLEQLRFKKKFDFELRVDPALPQHDLLVQPLILQPFVENAIRHGLQKMEGKGHLLVDIAQKGDQLVYKIEDNGPARARREAIRAATASPAEELQITRDRLMLHQKDATVEWVDLTDEASGRSGTRVEVSMRMQTEVAVLI